MAWEKSRVRKSIVPPGSGLAARARRRHPGYRRRRWLAVPGRDGTAVSAGGLQEVMTVPGVTRCWERQAGLDLVAVAAAVLALDDVPGLGDARPGRDVAQPYALVVGSSGPPRLHPHVDHF
jgi:hypothetical protein